MNEIVILSGKGGTGKTSIAGALSVLAEKEVVVADCDVDASNMHLLLNPKIIKQEIFYSGEIAKINLIKCNRCGKCLKKCRFNAIKKTLNDYFTNQMNCIGCGYCEIICPTKAIKMHERESGMLYFSKIKTAANMVHAELFVGAENSGKLVAKVKNEAKKIANEQNKEYIIIDGSPGIGCPVISSLAGAKFVLLVTEPSISGFNDLKRIIELIKKFNIKSSCVINKYDINIDKTNEIKNFLKTNNIDHIANIPFDKTFTNLMLEGKTIMESESEHKKTILSIWDKIKNIITP